MAATGRLADLLHDPRLLAGAAAGFACALLCGWAFHGLPLGTLSFWLASLPLFLAGLSFGPLAAGIGAVVGAAALLPTAGLRGVLVFLLAAGLPAASIVALALRRRELSLSWPFALLGIWPAVAGAASLLLGPAELEAAMQAQIAATLVEAGVEAQPGLVSALVRSGIALAGASLALPLLLCGVAAQRWLARRGLALRPRPAWREARLPPLYVVAPLLAALLVWLFPHGDAGLLLLSVAAALLMPVFLQGLTVVHGRLRGLWLIAFYLVLVVFSVPVLALVVGLGVFEPFGRKPSQPAPPN